MSVCFCCSAEEAAEVFKRLAGEAGLQLQEVPTKDGELDVCVMDYCCTALYCHVCSALMHLNVITDLTKFALVAVALVMQRPRCLH
jgi:hypothetical protein